MDEIIEEQGWTDETVLELLRRFIAERHLHDDVTAFLQAIADDENTGSEDPASGVIYTVQIGATSLQLDFEPNRGEGGNLVYFANDGEAPCVECGENMAHHGTYLGAFPWDHLHADLDLVVECSCCQKSYPITREG